MKGLPVALPTRLCDSQRPLPCNLKIQMKVVTCIFFIQLLLRCSVWLSFGASSQVGFGFPVPKFCNTTTATTIGYPVRYIHVSSSVLNLEI
eukprot:COSAG05_NODE_953_length_6443_cov_14.987390_5_plen_91_part_00